VKIRGHDMIYELKNEKIKVLLTTLGGTLASVQDTDGTEYLWQGDSKFWGGQAPVMFPICGSLRNDRAVIGGTKTTAMPRHGIVRKKEFELVEKSDNHISFRIDSDSESKNMFPYDFELYSKYELEDRSIKITYEVVNPSDEVLPFFVGAHPGFMCPFNQGEEYCDYYLDFEQKESCTVPTPVAETGLIDMEHRTPLLDNENRIWLKHELFHKDAIILDEIKSRSVKLISKNKGNGIRMDFADFPYLILWSSSNDGPFIAIEPWTGLSTCSDESDIFEEKRNVQILSPHSSREYSYSITLI